MFAVSKASSRNGSDVRAGTRMVMSPSRGRPPVVRARRRRRSSLRRRRGRWWPRPRAASAARGSSAPAFSASASRPSTATGGPTGGSARIGVQRRVVGLGRDGHVGVGARPPSGSRTSSFTQSMTGGTVRKLAGQLDDAAAVRAEAVRGRHEDSRDVGPAEPVDRLLRVADHEQVAGRDRRPRPTAPSRPRSSSGSAAAMRTASSIWIGSVSWNSSSRRRR